MPAVDLDWLPRAQVKRALLRAGAGRSTAAVEEYLNALTLSIFAAIVHKAAKYAQRAGRATVKSEDITRALGDLNMPTDQSPAALANAKRCAPAVTGARLRQKYDCFMISPAVFHRSAQRVLARAHRARRIGLGVSKYAQAAAEAALHLLVYEAREIVRLRQSETLTVADIKAVQRLLGWCFPLLARAA